MSNDTFLTDEHEQTSVATYERAALEPTPYQKYRQDYLDATKLTLVNGGMYEGLSQAPAGVLYARVEQEKAKSAIIDLIQDSPVYLCEEPVGDINVDFFHVQKSVASNVWAEMKRNGRTVADGTVFQWIAAATASVGQSFLVPSMEVPTTAVYRTGLNSEQDLYSYIGELYAAQCPLVNALSVGGQVLDKIDVVKFTEQPVVTIQNVPDEYVGEIVDVFRLATRNLPPESQAKSKVNGEKQKRTKK